MMRLDLATAEYIGARTQQQDLAAAMPFASGAVLVLADGLGGHESGADASRIVVDTFREACAGGRFNHPETRRQALRETVERANARIGEGVNPAHGHRGMASTVVAAVLAQDELNWVSVGDSHLYVWRGGRLRKLNEDHSQAGLMVRSGQYHASDPEVQAVKSVLVSALTGRKLEIVDLPQKSFRIEPGDVLILASDGLNTLDDEEIEGIVAEVRGNGAVNLSRTLLERVRSRRLERQDNTTVAIARVLERARPEAAEQAPRPPTEVLRKSEADAAPRPSAAAALEIDDASEVRTERVTPARGEGERLAAPDQATQPVARAAPVATTSPETPRTAPPSQPEPPPAPQAQKSPPEVPATRETQAPGATSQPRSPAAPTAAEAAPSSNPVLRVPEQRKPVTTASGARVSQPRSALAMAKEPAVPAASAPREGGRAAAKARWRFGVPTPPRAGFVRALLGILLLGLLALSLAIAALAALKPQWLSGIVPGFGVVEATDPAPDRAAPATTPLRPTPQPVAAPVPAPVPAVRPAQEAPARPDAPEAARAPAAQPKALPADPVPPSLAPDAAPDASAAGPASPPAPAAPREAKDATAPQAAPPAADLPLVEPQRPARPPPAARQRRNQPVN
jgi:serine/threonine protein phosphatase PrpC